MSEQECNVSRLEVYIKAIRVAQASNQVIGEKSDYYITIQQLEAILGTAGGKK